MSKMLVLISVLCSTSIYAQKKLERFLSHPAKAELTSLDLSNCDLKSLPVELALCTQLSSLDLSDNELDSLPAFFADFILLKRLDLKGNKFKLLPRSLADAPALTELFLAQNPIQKLSLPADEYKKLNYLDLWDCEIQAIDSSICNHPSLRKIDLRRNFLGTRDLDWLFECASQLEIKSTWGCNCD